MCGVVLLTPVQRVLVLTVLVGCKFFVLELFRFVGIEFKAVLHQHQAKPQTRTFIVVFHLRAYCFFFPFLLLSLLFIYIVLLVYDISALFKDRAHSEKCQCFFSFRFVLFYLFYFPKRMARVVLRPPC